MTTELKYSLFSAFHHTFDEDGSLRFLIGLDIRQIQNQDGFLGANLIRYRLQYPSLKSKDPAEKIIMSISPPPSNTQQTDFIHFTGIDSTIEPFFYYKYVLSVTVAVKDHAKQYDHFKQNGFRNSLKSKTRTIEYELPIINFKEVTATGLASINNIGFKKVLKGEVSKFFAGEGINTKTDNHKFVIYEKSKNIEQFSKIKNKSKAPALAGLAINTEKITKENLSEQNFLTIGISFIKENINLEYMSGYIFNDVASEMWEPLTEEILDGSLNSILVRVASPTPYINKYFIVGEE